jgi:hypothetical protein
MSGWRTIKTCPASLSSPLLAGREALLEGGILSLSGPIDKKPADKPRARPGGRAEPSVATNRAGDCADPGARGGAGQRALLGRGHIGASSDRQSNGREQK